MTKPDTRPVSERFTSLGIALSTAIGRSHSSRQMLQDSDRGGLRHRPRRSVLLPGHHPKRRQLLRLMLYTARTTRVRPKRLPVLLKLRLPQ